MKQYQHNKCNRRDSHSPNERYTKSTLHVDLNPKDKFPNRTHKDKLNGTDKQRKVTSSFINTRGHDSDGNHPPISKHPGHGHNQKESLISSRNHDVLRPSSCTCPHGPHQDEEIRPSSCPYGHKHERKQPRASCTCSFGHSHEPDVHPHKRPTLHNRSKSATERTNTRKHRFYGLNVPREPLIEIPQTISYKENGHEMQARSRTTSNSRRKRTVPFSKSYKNGNVFPLSIVVLQH